MLTDELTLPGTQVIVDGYRTRTYQAVNQMTADEPSPAGDKILQRLLVSQ